MILPVEYKSLKNRFLLSMPSLRSFGDYFSDTITYVCRHNRDGALGLIVNRPLSMTVGELLGQLELPCSIDPSTRLIEGGPVRGDCAFILHTNDVECQRTVRVGNALALTTEMEMLEAIGRGEGPRQYLIALGYAGWGEGQLEREMDANTWLTCPSSKSVIFDIPFEDRVDSAARLLGIDFSLMSGHSGNA